MPGSRPRSGSTSCATWASHAVMAGVPLMVVARNLGHVDTGMVEKHYGRLSESYVTEAIRAGAPRYGSEPAKGVVPLRYAWPHVLNAARSLNLPVARWGPWPGLTRFSATGLCKPCGA
jgi:hypothetical protein